MFSQVAARADSVARQEWRQKGHGKYEEVTDQKAFFEEAKSNDRMVCHFYRSSTKWCTLVDKHLAIIASQHIETRFIKVCRTRTVRAQSNSTVQVDVEKAPFICEHLNIYMLPTLYCSKDAKTIDKCVLLARFHRASSLRSSAESKDWINLVAKSSPLKCAEEPDCS